jgi:hypothetical protein
MNWFLLLYNVLLAVVVIDALASSYAAFYMFHLRQRFGWYLAFTFTGCAVEAWIAVITAGFSPTPARIVVWITIVRILARLFKAVSMVLLPLFLLGLVNGDHPEVMRDKDDAK